MGYYVQHLEPGTLYFTLSVAHQQSYYRPSRSQDTTPYIVNGSKPEDQKSSEPTTAQADTVEEFQWGLYFHRQLRDGTWYTLQRPDPASEEAILGTVRPEFQLVRENVEQSPRLDFFVVGIIRGLSVSEDVAQDLTSYLDWLTQRTAMKAQRTFMWATSVFFRTRKHVFKVQRHRDLPESVVEALLREALEFAQEEVWYTLGRQLPRPILASSHLYDSLTRDSDETFEIAEKVEAELGKIEKKNRRSKRNAK